MSVKSYLLDKEQCALEFKTSHGDPVLNEGIIEAMKNMELGELVYDVLDKTQHYHSSKVGDSLYETDPGRVRSSLDIWRHVKYLKPEITIYQVMNTLFANRKDYVGQFCGGVKRRVFICKENKPGWRLLGTDRYDEYDLVFKEWETISEEKDK